MAAGETVIIGQPSSRVYVVLDASGATPSAEPGLQNSGTIDAGPEGSVSLIAGDIYSLAFHQTAEGAIRAGDIHIEGGDGGVVKVAGTLDAADLSNGGVGGSIRVLGDKVGLFGNARLDASGDVGGGKVLVGGNFQGKGPERNASRTFVGPDTSIAADAVSEGDGGRVIVWADDLTKFYGSITARGGAEAGDGGFAEVSGKESLVFQGPVDLTAVRGTSGTLLLDPKNGTITGAPSAAGGTSANVTANDAFTDNPAGDTSFQVNDLLEALRTTNILLRVNNDFTINSALNAEDSTDTATNPTAVADRANRSFTVQAGRSILINADITMNDGAISLTANETVANGVVDANRDLGNAVITMVDGVTLDAGTSDITVTLGSGPTTNNASGDITVENLTTTGNVLVVNNGPTAGSGIIIEGTVTASGSGTVLLETNAVAGIFTQAAGAAIASGTGALTVTADRIELDAAADTITTTGAITLQPVTPNRAIVIDSQGGAGNFALTQSEVATLTDGATSITIGRSDGTGGATINAITFNDPVTVRSPFGGTITVAQDLTGTGDASVTLDGSGATTTLRADITTAGQDITISDNVQVGLDGGGDPPVTLSTGVTLGGNISITGTTNREGFTSRPLQLISGSGTTTLTGAVGNLGALSTLTLQADNAGATGTVTFDGALTATSVVTFGRAYDVAFNADATITSDTNFLNTGTLTLGDAATDSITFAGGLATTGNASNPTTVNVAGTVVTTNTQMDLGAITLMANAELDTGTAAASSMNVGAVTGGGFALTLDSGADAAADITVASVDNVSTLTIRDSGGTTVTGTVGAGMSGAVTITDTTGTVAFQDNATITTLATATQPYNVSFTGATNSVTSDTNFLNTGTLTLGDAATDSITFAGGLATTGNATNPTTVNIAGTVATTNTQMDLAAITLTGDTTLSAGAGGITLDGPLDGNQALALNSTGTTDLNGVIGGTTPISSLTTNAGGTTELGANLSAQGGTITFSDNVVVAEGSSVTLDTTAGGNAAGAAVDLQGSLDGTAAGAMETLAINAGTAGAVTINSVTGTVGTVDSLNLTVTNSGSTTVSGAATVGMMTITDTTGTVAFQGDATITTLNTATQPYNVSFTGTTNSVTTDTNFLNTGTLTLGDAATDSITFAGGLATTGNASNPTTVNVAGTVATTNTQMDLGAITLMANAALDTGTAAASSMNAGAVTGSGFALILDSGADAAANITVASVDNVSTLTIRDSGGTTVTGTVGAGTSGAMTITDTTGTVAFQDNATITTLNTATQPYNVSFTGATNSVTTDTNFLNTGTLTLGDAATDSITFAGDWRRRATRATRRR